MRFHTQTAGCSLTAQQPENNIVRTAIEALAGVLGGTQSLHTNALDEVLALPTERAAQIALRTQQVIAHETGVANVIDPLGGSYFVEALTDKTEALAEEYFAKIDDMGKGSILEGMLVGIERGYFQSEIADAAYREQERYEKGRLIKVGVNEFVEEDEEPLDTLKIPHQIEVDQIDAVRGLRSQRDEGDAASALDELKAVAADEGQNMVPALIDCARAYCTEGEIVTALKEIFGEYTETPRF
jgi:methylmalonyl-CoA mutase N-terminal domain/subunit